MNVQIFSIPTVLLVLCCNGLVTSEQYDVTVVEKGVMVQEHVTLLGGGLQKYEVPRHHNLEHVQVYLDFNNEVIAIRFPDLHKCQVSTLPQARPSVTNQSAGLKFARNYIYAVSETKMKMYGKVEQPYPLSDTSFLRTEILEACEGMPIFWADVVDLNGAAANDTFLIPGSQEQYKHITHRMRRQADTYTCPITQFNQKCKLRSRKGACYYFVLCPGANATKTCIEHVRHGQTECKPCCTKADAPRDGSSMFKHCDVLVF